ncbi:MAG: hypothetical protein EXQ85_04985 [Alphaproteobacteria bacterium]|nr:hypothetical protein [Alphaproteobacteria bacterium]
MILDRWKPEWEEWVGDRTIPLHDRLVRFYLAFTEAIFSYECMRIFFFMWMTGDNPREHYVNSSHRRHFRRICAEVRHDAGLPPLGDVALLRQEEELAAGFHGGTVYFGVRQFIFGLTPLVSRETFIRQQVAVFLRGAGAEVRALIVRRSGTRPRRSAMVA